MDVLTVKKRKRLSDISHLHLRIRLRTSLGVGCAADEKYDSDHRALHLQFWTARLRRGAEESDHGLGQALG